MAKPKEVSKRVIYSFMEKAFLKDLILKYQDVVENKKTDSCSLQQKCKAWEEIEKEFNSVEDHNKRTSKQLKKLWENIKTERKKELALSSSETFLSNGGPPPEPPKEDAGDQNTWKTPRPKRLRGNVWARNECDARVRKVQAQIQQDAEIKNLIKEELKYKIAAAKLELLMKEEEADHNRRKWDLEIKLLQKKLTNE